MFDPDQFHDPEFRTLVLAARAVIAERVHRGVATPPLSERVKSGHLWTPQIRPFRRPETGVEFYFTASCVCKVVWILVRQLRGPHFSTCA